MLLAPLSVLSLGFLSHFILSSPARVGEYVMLAIFIGLFGIILGTMRRKYYFIGMIALFLLAIILLFLTLLDVFGKLPGFQDFLFGSIIFSVFVLPGGAIGWFLKKGIMLKTITKDRDSQ